MFNLINISISGEGFSSFFQGVKEMMPKNLSLSGIFQSATAYFNPPESFTAKGMKIVSQLNPFQPEETTFQKCLSTASSVFNFPVGPSVLGHQVTLGESAATLAALYGALKFAMKSQPPARPQTKTPPSETYKLDTEEPEEEAPPSSPVPPAKDTFNTVFGQLFQLYAAEGRS